MTQLEDEYRRRFELVLKPIAVAIETQLREYFEGQPRIDRVTARAKSVDRFLAKARTVIDGKPKYSDPLTQIQDQVGARIVTYYVSDVPPVSDIVEKYYRGIESKTVVPDSQWMFGYFGRHHIVLVPTDVILPDFDASMVPEVFEIQVKTLFQHAWSEANHDLGYKPGEKPVSPDTERLLAFTSAQAWGADRVFDELFQKHAH